MKKIILCVLLLILSVSPSIMTGCKGNNDSDNKTSSEVSKDELSLRSWSIGEIREALDSLLCPVIDIDFRTEESDSTDMICFKTNVTYSGSSAEIYSILSDLCKMESDNLFVESIRVEGNTEKMNLLAVISNPTAKAGSRLSDSEKRNYISTEWACIDRSGLIFSFIKLHSEYSVSSIESTLIPDNNNRVEIKLSAGFTSSSEFFSYQNALSKDGSFELAEYETSDTSSDDTAPSLKADIIIITDKFRKSGIA